MSTKEKESSKIFDTMDSSLHQYFSMASEKIDAPQPIFDEIAANEIRYKQGVLINQGGVKKIHQIEDALTGRPVAMANLKDPEDPKKVEHFLREARLTATLEHPNIIPVYDIGLNDDGDPFFTMKLISGKSLSQILRDQSDKNLPRLSIQSLMDIFIKICDAVSYSHSKGILHLDLKPSNIQVGEYGEVLVCDWGLAKVIDTPDETIYGELDPCLYNDITLDGVIKGTPGFMAPEQIDSTLGDKTKRTDIYALGGILYTMLTLQPPVKNRDIQKMLDDTINGKISLPSSVNTLRNIPLSLEAVAMKALQTDPVKRYHKVITLRKDIHKWLGGFATSAENAGFTKAAYLLFQRHKVVAFLILFIMISLIISFGVITQKEKVASEALKLYEEEKRQTEIIGQELSERMVFLAKQAIDSNEMDEALEYINRAIESNPKNSVAHFIKGRVHFFRQEFNSSLKSFSKLPKDNSYNFQKFLSPAKKYAALKPDDQLLKSNDFIELLKNFKTNNVMSKLYRYEGKKHTSLQEHMKTCAFILKHYNPNVKKLRYKFSIDGEKVHLDLSDNPNLTGIRILRNLPVTHLNISNTGVWLAKVIDNMPLVEINVVNTKIKDFKPLYRVKSLRTIYVDKERALEIKTPNFFKGKIIEL